MGFRAIIHAHISASLVSPSLYSLSFAQAEETWDLRQGIAAIRSGAQVKAKIEAMMVALEQRAVDSCIGFTAIAICESVGMFDIRADGKILMSGTLRVVQ